MENSIKKSYRSNITSEESQELKDYILKNLFKVDRNKLVSDLSDKYSIHPDKVNKYIDGVNYAIKRKKEASASYNEFMKKRRNYNHGVD